MDSIDCVAQGEHSTLPPVSKPKRPRSITILSILLLTQSLSLLATGIYQAQTHGWNLSERFPAWRFIPMPLFESLSSAVILIILGGITFLTSLAILGLVRNAWLAAMTIQGVGLLFGLINYLRNRPSYLGILISVIIVLYLNHQEVQDAFRQREGKPDV